ncbi:Carbonic anhydrase 2 [Planctomycetes bacterium Pla163]|uniref:Carbonic anhydrase 2 n=1 Tax=Rohdeia mirabilis TaxID=2528008 RepID=A0A518CZQ7_9BACT|nr:Carbonic anhydrase 2 [Planctomycetes bacterium Pla163]
MTRPLAVAGLWIGAAALVVACAPSRLDSRSGGHDGHAGVVTKEAQAAMTPRQVFDDLRSGNERFVDGNLTNYDFGAQVEATAKGQFPKAVVLSCLDSRVPPEIIFDQGIGDIFVGRVAGNFENVDMLGSMEFATAAAGSKLIVVLGHSACGAVKGAADGVELGNLTAMLDNFDPALAAAKRTTPGPYDSSNTAYVSAAVEANVRQTMADVLARSSVIKDQVDAGKVMVVGGVYDLATGRVTWIDA